MTRHASLPACALAALAGVIAMFALPVLPPLAVCVAGALALCAACARFAPGGVLPALLGAAGFLSAAVQARHVLEHRWPEHAAGERAIVRATVESIPVVDAAGARFDALLRSEQRSGARSFRARILYGHGDRVPRAGERWQLLVTLYPPRGRLNPESPDVERHLFRERVHAVGRVVPSRLNVRLSVGHRPIARLRERIAARVQSQVADRDGAALIAALAVGHTGGMSRQQWRVFNVTGTTHLVAISGLHVTLFAVVAIAVARRIWGVLASAMPHVPRESFAATLGLAAATAYAVLAGFSVPTQRTLVMLGAWFTARSISRHTTPAVPLAVALIGVLAIDPFAPLSAGFWLSFLAMAAIVLVTGTRAARGGSLAEALRVQVAVAVVLAPATLAWFGGVSLAGIAVNLIAIPVVSFVFVPLILLAVAMLPWEGASALLFSLAARIHEALWPWLVSAADVPHAMLFVSPSGWWLVFAAAAALFAVLPWPVVLRVASVAWLLPLAVSTPAPRPGELELTLLDTGKNVAMLARVPGYVVVRGIGEGFGTNGRSVENALLPLLRARAIGRIDLLILDDADRHAARGLNALLANVAVARMSPGNGLPDPVRAADCRAGERWRRHPFEFHVLSAACDLLVQNGSARVLLNGDGALVSHGDAGAPAKLALSSGGRERTADAARALTTASSGAITVRVTAEGIRSVHEERAARRVWRGQRRMPDD